MLHILFNWSILIHYTDLNSQVFLIGLIVSCCKGKKSVIEGEVDEEDSDMSDDEPPLYYGWQPLLL